MRLLVKEASVAMAIRREVIKLRDLSDAYTNERITKVQFSARATKVVARLCELAQGAERFDVVLPVVEFGVFSKSFWRWYNWWAGVRPGRDWIESPHTPAFKLVIV